MPLLPAVVPAIPEDRARVVGARLARKIAPLFGVPWSDAPFPFTWVCDFSTLTLAEIGRGAPLPPRTDGPAAERAVMTGPRRADGKPERLPHELANATLQRFGPDAKAAVMLTGANRLLEPVTAAVIQAMRHVDGALPARLRLAAWASMVLEAFRSQPALFAAAIQARAIQRAMLDSWALPVPHRLIDQPFARCEIGARHAALWRAGTPQSPVDLDIVDHTVPAVRLPGTGPHRHDRAAAHWLRQLALIGTAYGDGYLWLSEITPGHRVVEAFVPQPQAVLAYLAEAVPDAVPDPDQPLPTIPDAESLHPLDPTARRALILGLTAVIRQIRSQPNLRESMRTMIPSVMDQVAALADTTLGADDPVTLVTRCRAADIRVETLRAGNDPALVDALADLRRQLDRCHRAHRAGRLDRGTLTDLVYSVNVEVNAIRRTNATQPASTLPSPEELNVWLRRSWRIFLTLVDIQPDRLDSEDRAVAQQAGYHLHAYASYLAGQSDATSLRAAVHLYRDVVLPARIARHQRTGQFEPVRQSLQTAARATTGLARHAALAGDPAQARDWATTGHQWVTHALADPHTQNLVSIGNEAAARFALLAAPALLAAVEHGVPGTGIAEVNQATRLADAAQQFADQLTAYAGQSYTRQPEIDSILEHAARLRAMRIDVRHAHT